MNHKLCDAEIQNERCKKMFKIKHKIKSTDPIAAVASGDIRQEQQQQHQLQISAELSNRSYRFLKTIQDDYERFVHLSKYCISAEQKRMERNEQELVELQKQYNNMKVEEAEIKRKRWCRYCEAEATFLNSSGLYFYCSLECEEYHCNLLGALKEDRNTKLHSKSKESSLSL